MKENKISKDAALNGQINPFVPTYFRGQEDFLFQYQYLQNQMSWFSQNDFRGKIKKKILQTFYYWGLLLCDGEVFFLFKNSRKLSNNFLQW